MVFFVLSGVDHPSADSQGIRNLFDLLTQRPASQDSDNSLVPHSLRCGALPNIWHQLHLTHCFPFPTYTTYTYLSIGLRLEILWCS